MKLIKKEEKQKCHRAGSRPGSLDTWSYGWKGKSKFNSYIVALVIPPGVIGYIHNRQNADPASGKSLQTAWIWGIETTDQFRSRNLDKGLDKAIS